MADYIYTMEIRLTPDQQRGVTLVQDIARAAGMNVYLTGGAVRDIISGFAIHDLDFTVQGNPLKLTKDLERAEARIAGTDEDIKTLYLTLPGKVRAEISMARVETYEKVGKPAVVTPATMIEDLRRRDFTVNAMALSLNPGSLGLLMDPFNGVADIEAKLLRVLNNYAFVEDPSRLIRATRFAARFGWPFEERTQARFDSAKENNYIEHIGQRAIGREIEQIAYEDDPLNIVHLLEKEGWLTVLNPHWSGSKIDSSGLAALQKTRQQMNELGYTPDAAPAVLYFLTAKLADKDIADIRKHISRKDLVEEWRSLEQDAKDFAKRLAGKEGSTPSKAWKLLSEGRPELTLFLAVTSKQQAVSQNIKNFFTKWRQVQQRLPLPEMVELRIVPSWPDYAKVAHEVFMLLLDGKLRSTTEIVKFLKPLAPPPPPPPPPPPVKRGRAAKAAAAAAQAAAATASAAAAVSAKGPEKTAGKKKGKAAATSAGVAVAPVTPAPAAKKVESKPAPAKAVKPAKVAPKKAAAAPKRPASAGKKPAKPTKKPKRK
jgi:tRNA nucleotidyltransferase (CCA-adding enzyme)